MVSRRQFLALAAASTAGAAVGVSGFRWPEPTNHLHVVPVPGDFAAASIRDTGRVLWEFPWGSREGEFGLLRGGVDSTSWGPSAIRAIDDHIAVVDNHNGTLVWIDPTGRVDASTELPWGGIVDIASGVEDRVLALSRNPQVPGILIVGADGRTDLVPVDRDVSGWMTGLFEAPEQSSVITERGQFAVDTGAVDSAKRDGVFGRSKGPRVLTVASSELVVTPDRLRGAKVAVDGVSVDLGFSERVKEVRPLGVDSQSDIVLLVQEVVDLDNTVVTQTWIAGIAKGGQVAWVARYPNEDALYIPESPVAMTQDGRVLAMVGRPESFQLRELTKVAAPYVAPWDVLALAALAPAVPDTVDKNAIRASCVSGNTMENTAWGYINTSQYLDSTDIGGSCTRRAKPRYLGSSGTYWSVPYQWGGFHTASQYKSYMSANEKRAGDYSNDPWTSCASGVDCSGFVSRCWQLSSRYWTGSLPNISYAISEATQGDIYNKVGDHVVMVDYESETSGVMVFESTTRSGLDRVVRNMVSWSYLSGYSRRRYDNKC